MRDQEMMRGILPRSATGIFLNISEYVKVRVLRAQGPQRLFWQGSFGRIYTVHYVHGDITGSECAVTVAKVLDRDTATYTFGEAIAMSKSIQPNLVRMMHDNLFIGGVKAIGSLKKSASAHDGTERANAAFRSHKAVAQTLPSGRFRLNQRIIQLMNVSATKGMQSAHHESGLVTTASPCATLA